MRSLALIVLLFIPLNVYAASSAFASPGLPTRSTLSVEQRSCGQGYHCQDIRVQLCVKKGRGRSIWSLTPRDAHLRRGVSTRDCTVYAVGLNFSLRYNGKQAAVQKHSLKCAVQVQHGVSVAIEKCYSVEQKDAQKRFTDLVSGARVCVRTLGSGGHGCHQDYAINIYAYANGRLTGEAWMGSKIYVPRL